MNKAPQFARSLIRQTIQQNLRQRPLAAVPQVSTESTALAEGILRHSNTPTQSIQPPITSELNPPR